MLIILSITASVYFFYIKPAAEEKRLMADFEKRFFRADTSDIEFIRLDAGRGPVTIEKTPSGWMITRPYRKLPDMGSINKIFSTLSHGRLIKIVGDESRLNEFGFDRTWVVLALGFRGRIDVLQIAGENPAGTGNYAYAERLGKIFLVNKELARELNLKPFDLREKRLFLFDPAELGEIIIRRKSDTIIIRRGGDSWVMTSPVQSPASMDEVTHLIEVLNTQKAQEFIKWKKDFESLTRRMHVTLKDIKGNEIGDYELYFWGTEWFKGIVAHKPGSEEALRTRRDFWMELEGDHSHYMYRNLLAFDPAKAGKIVIRDGDNEYVMTNESGQWKLNGSPLSSLKTNNIMKELLSWKAVKLINEDRDLGQTRVSITVTGDGYTRHVTVTNFNMDHEISGSKMFIPEEPGKPKNRKIDYLYTRTDNLKQSAIISSIDLEKILNAVRGGAN
jgi:hypothetical protein